MSHHPPPAGLFSAPPEEQSGPVNANPTAADDAAGSTDEDSPFITGNVLSNDNDDDGDPLSVSSVDPISAGGANITDNSDGTFNYDPNGAFENLAPGESVTDTFEYTVSDGRNGTDTATVSVEVTGVNDQPSREGDAHTVDEDSAASADITVLNNDEDPRRRHPLLR